MPTSYLAKVRTPTRRRFLCCMGAGALGLGLTRAATAAGHRAPGSSTPSPRETKLPAGGRMPMRPLGKTGVQVSLLGLGGYHIGVPSARDAERIIHAAIDHGVTFLDNCWDYNAGASEERMGKALAGSSRRQSVFLMTKIDGRTRAAATAQLEQSLRRLRTDAIDLLQVHEVIRMTDAERVFGPGGAMEALQAAQQAGKIRFIGFTGHKEPSMHLNMLEVAGKNGFRFDAVQMPLNVLDAHYHSFAQQVLPVLRKNDIAALGMKALSDGVLVRRRLATVEECLRYSMSLPTSTVISGFKSIGELEQALAVALAFTPLDDAQMKALLARTAGPAGMGRYELYKTTDRNDGTARNPSWLG